VQFVGNKTHLCTSIAWKMHLISTFSSSLLSFSKLFNHLVSDSAVVLGNHLSYNNVTNNLKINGIKDQISISQLQACASARAHTHKINKIKIILHTNETKRRKIKVRSGQHINKCSVHKTCKFWAMCILQTDALPILKCKSINCTQILLQYQLHHY
jgi:hypothetical protein